MNYNWQGQGDGMMQTQSPGSPQAPQAPGREGYYTYLQGQGYGGQMGPDMRAYAQTLRDQGQHPFRDYRQSMGLGGLSGQGRPDWQAMGQGQWQPGQQWGGQPPNMPPQMGHMGPGSGLAPMPGRPDPRPMNSGVAVGEPNGLAGLARRPEQLIRR